MQFIASAIAAAYIFKRYYMNMYESDIQASASARAIIMLSREAARGAPQHRDVYTIYVYTPGLN